MAKYRVKAFFMHESERAAAEQAEQAMIITEAEWTDGYVLCVIDEESVDGLVEQGLIIIPVERIETITVPADLPRARGGDGARRDAGKVVSSDPLESQFYVIGLNGPLTRDRRDTLDRHNIRLLERLSGNDYTAHLAPADVAALASEKTVTQIRLYSQRDTLRTGSVENRSAARGGPAGGTPTRFTRLFEARTHRSQDLQKVVQWLQQRGRTPFPTHPDALQVALVQNGNDLSELAELPEVAAVAEVLPARPLDRMARQVLRLEQPGKPALGFDGEGQIIGIADTGLDDGHPDFQGRVAGISALGRPGDHSDQEGHGTHVAGCAAGDGKASKGEVQGAAPKAKLFFQSILGANGTLSGLPKDLGKLFAEAYQNGVRIHNNSWGEFGFAKYSQMSLDVDRFVAANPDMLIVIAAGNDGTALARGEEAGTNSQPGFVDWPSVAVPGTAKNGLTVGASRNNRSRGGYATLTWADAWANRYPKPPIGKQRVSGDVECLAAFSARGPSDDGRIKPDLVAPGTDIAAARSRQAPLFKFWGAYPNNANYAFMGGTSMAAPYVAGCAALVREYYEKKESYTTPSAALLKATLINGTARMSGDDAIAPREGEPNFHQGFGRIDMASTIPSPMSPDLKLAFVDTWKDPPRIFQESGKALKYQITVGDKLPLRICLAWTDPSDRALQNSLLLTADNFAGEKFVGNQKVARLLYVSAPKGMAVDPNNNVQIVRIEKPKAGLYTVKVTADNLLKPPQAFALVITGDLQSPLSLVT